MEESDEKWEKPHSNWKSIWEFLFCWGPTPTPLNRFYSPHIQQGQAVFYLQKTHVSRLEDSQYWVNKNGLGGAAYIMIQNHKGGVGSVS